MSKLKELGNLLTEGDEGATPIPVFAMQLSAASDKMGFENPAANWEFDGLRLAERWWFKA